MTTDTELRDLLAAEADGLNGGSGGWEDVMRRGRRRQRVRRVQNLALVVLVAGVAVTAIAVAADETKVETTPPAGRPAPTAPDDIDPSPLQIGGARAQGNSVKLFFGVVPHLCSDLRPILTQSDDQITVRLVDVRYNRQEFYESGVPWADCVDGFQRNAIGTIELRAPAADRPLVDRSTGQRVPVTDSADLLFPTSLPAPFDLAAFVETNGVVGGVSVHYSSFRFEADSFQSVQLISSSDPTSNGSGCAAGQTVEVRGTQGCFEVGEVEPSAPAAAVGGALAWEENGRAFYLAMVSVDAGESTLDELLAIAEGLEPLPG